MLNKIKQRNESGFTIIEVMIVLAIAALILLVVFLAVPALQRSSRNTQRRADATNSLSSINNWLSNNGGALPTSSQLTNTTALADFKPGYYTGATPVNYGGTPIPTTATIGGTPSGTTLTTDNMIFEPGTVCSGNTATTTGATARSYSLIYAVEAGSTATPQCIGS